jgi:hypothetical protein
MIEFVVLVNKTHISFLDGPPPTQDQPVYIVQLKLHPSPELMLPSSHCKTNLFASPHISLQIVTVNPDVI